MPWLKHVFAIALAGALLLMGSQKFGADNYIFQNIAQNSGIAFFEPTFRIFTGVLEVLAGLMMLLPRTRGAGAALASAIVSGAVVFHLSPWLGTRVAMSAGEEPSYSLFTMALIFLVLALVNLYLNRNTVPLVGRQAE